MVVSDMGGVALLHTCYTVQPSHHSSDLPTFLNSILMQVLRKVKESEHEIQVNVAGNQDWTTDDKSLL